MDGNSLFKARFRFTEEDDVHLLREVLGLNPYEDHSRWTIIQVNMIQIIGNSLSIRTLRERVQNLIKKFLVKKKAEEGMQVNLKQTDHSS
ncbi:unnamed protein product [Ceutorhynchus assimilis]|uniref:Uncharacterized protein n=1 Tax=Ceutorhynchus assimilis TaxID=467358 RepID=A0A9N9N3C9_9CUCU|nr:unnamed protein product [Ceutorhynchus assimilis]